MNLRRLTAHVAAAGATTALIAGGLVAATSTTATAADATGDYTCAVPILGNQTFPLSVTVPLLPPTATAGFPVPGGLLSYTSTITVPAAAAGALGNLGVNGGTIDDFTMNVGSKAVRAPGTYTATPPAEDGSVVMEGAGANDAFTLPKPGSYAVKLPSAFTFSPTVNGAPLDLGSGPVTVACASDTPATLGTVVLSKQVGTMTSKVTKTAKGYKLVATVKNEFSTATGKVVAKLGAKSTAATLKKGKATFNLPKSAKGKKVTLTYKGDTFTKSTKTTVTIK